MVTHSFESIYAELKRIAHAELKRHSGGINTTALVHECYLKLAGYQNPDSREHLIALVTRTMRQVLIDEARKRGTEKRGTNIVHVTLDASSDAASSSAGLIDVLAFDQELNRLASEHQRMARALELEFFGGVEPDEIAQMLGVNVRTIQRDLLAARTLMRSRLAG